MLALAGLLIMWSGFLFYMARRSALKRRQRWEQEARKQAITDRRVARDKAAKLGLPWPAEDMSNWLPTEQKERD